VWTAGSPQGCRASVWGRRRWHIPRPVMPTTRPGSRRVLCSFCFRPVWATRERRPHPSVAGSTP
jgi:hypothetical protein